MTRPKHRVLSDRDRHLAAVHGRRTPVDRARALAERLAEVAAMRRGGRASLDLTGRAMTTGAGSFIERHGLVRYTERLGARYPRTGVCEIGSCLLDAQRDAANRADDRARLAAVLVELAALTERARDRRRHLESELAHAERERDRLSRRIAYYDSEEIRQWDERQAARPLFFDHCHAHGWVRGLLCLRCNNDMGMIDAQFEGWEPHPAQLAHWNRCPECAAEGWRPLWRHDEAAGRASADAWEAAARRRPPLSGDALREIRTQAARLVNPAVVRRGGYWCVPIDAPAEESDPSAP